MEIKVSKSKQEMGRMAAEQGAGLIREAIAERGSASIIVATGSSQFEMLDVLVKEDISWEQVSAFHLDEYIGISVEHPASFRKYLKERFVDRVPLKEFTYINGEGDTLTECKNLSEKIANFSIDCAFIGIGENGHLAFNDPPADFLTETPYIVVSLDDRCRMQQLGEGWFRTFDAVPDKAISMSVNHILKSKSIICTVPDSRKAEAVRLAIQGPVTPELPASKLQTHKSVWMYLDEDSASLLGDQNSR